MSAIQPQGAYPAELPSSYSNDTSYTYPMMPPQFRPQDPAYPYAHYVVPDQVPDIPYYAINTNSVLNTFAPSYPKVAENNSQPHPYILDVLESSLRSKTREGVSERTVQLVMIFFRQHVHHFPLISPRHLSTILIEPITPIGVQLLHAMAAFALFAISTDYNTVQEARDCLNKARAFSSADFSHLSVIDTELLIATYSFVQYIENFLKKE